MLCDVCDVAYALVCVFVFVGVCVCVCVCVCTQVVLTVDEPCQLLGVGLCGTEGSFTVDLEVYEVCVCVCVCVCV